MRLDREQDPVSRAVNGLRIGENGRADDDGITVTAVNRHLAHRPSGTQNQVPVPRLLDSGGKNAADRPWADDSDTTL
jgi:hypothetical protein